MIAAKQPNTKMATPTTKTKLSSTKTPHTVVPYPAGAALAVPMPPVQAGLGYMLGIA